MKHYKILLPLIFLAFFLRVWQLPQTPPGLWYDEAYNAMDALWMIKTGIYPLFFVGNNGREPMWHYLLLGSTSLLGNIPFAVRWAGTLVGILTVPIMYRFAYALLQPFARRNRDRCWLALVATGWLTVSWWHLLNSRSGLRPILLPPLLMLSLYFWMAGIRDQGSGVKCQASRFTFSVPRHPFLNFILAGIFLGLSQYTYLPARMAPLIFIGFAVLATLPVLWAKYRPSASRDSSHTADSRAGVALWLGLLITLLTAALVFAPLGLFFLNNPDAVSSRTGDVVFAPETFGEMVAHLLQAVSFFFGAGHELYRHHLPGRAMLGWLEIPFFLIGLIALLRPTYLRRPETQLILLGMVVMWLPALLASPPVHSLRPIGLLPFYYLIVALGLYQVARFTYHVLPHKQYAVRAAFGVLPCVFIFLNGLVNVYDLQRWANHPEVYKEYNGPLVDLTHHLLGRTQTSDVIIPFHLYVHPSTRYLLWRDFPEVKSLPPLLERPLEMLIIPDSFQVLYVGNIPVSPAMVLLTRDENGQGAAYLSRPPRVAEQAAINEELAALQTQLKPFVDRLGRTVALFAPVLPQYEAPTPEAATSPLAATLYPLFDPAPLRTTNVNWANVARLIGYDVTPPLARPGEPMTLNLYWQSLTDETFEHRSFLQLIDGAGNPINQWEGEAFREDMYRWRPEGMLPTQHTLWIGPDTPPGPYLVRIGFFDDRTGERLPLHLGDGSPPLDQVQLGLFYVSSDGTDPRQPATPFSTTFGNAIQLVGITTTPYSLLPTPYAFLPVTLHWQDIQPTDKPYTIFLQLLNAQGEVVSGWDRQPFGGLYPTHLWSPGEVIADTIFLPLPDEGLPPDSYRLVTGFYDFDTGQRLPVAGGGDFAELAEFVVN